MSPASLPCRNCMFLRAVASLSVFVYYFGIAAADKGYDKEENPTGAYKAYCVPLQYNFELGLCQGISGNVNVCAVTAEGVHPLSAVSWLNREVMPKGSPHMDKTIIQGDKSYNDLQKYFHDWVCKQVDPQSLPVVALSESQKQSAACNFLWRRDQEIQKLGSPTPTAPWGVFTYQAAGGTPNSFMFKGAPKSQCTYNYDCRNFNDPGSVYVCCDYCEQYFSSYCDATRAQIVKFCMEQAQCVCNSVTKPCYNTYPVYGAPCSPAPPAARPAAALAAALAAAAAALLLSAASALRA